MRIRVGRLLYPFHVLGISSVLVSNIPIALLMNTQDTCEVFKIVITNLYTCHDLEAHKDCHPFGEGNQSHIDFFLVDVCQITRMEIKINGVRVFTQCLIKFFLVKVGFILNMARIFVDF